MFDDKERSRKSDEELAELTLKNQDFFYFSWKDTKKNF